VTRTTRRARRRVDVEGPAEGWKIIYARARDDVEAKRRGREDADEGW